MILEKVKELLANQLSIDDVNSIKPESKIIDELGADSLDVVELLMAMEEEFNVSINEDQGEKLVTVNDIVKLIEKSK